MAQLPQFLAFLILLVPIHTAPVSNTAEETVSYLQSDISSLKGTIKGMSEWMKEMQSDIDIFKSYFDGINALLTRMKPIPDQITVLEASQDERSSTVEALGGTVTELETGVNRTTARQQEMEISQTQHQEELSALRAGQDDMRRTLATLSAAWQRLESRQNETVAWQRDTDRALSQLQKDVRDLASSDGTGGDGGGDGGEGGEGYWSGDGYWMEGYSDGLLFSD